MVKALDRPVSAAGAEPGELTFSDVPAELRPSTWREWQKRTPREPDEDHLAWRIRCDQEQWEGYAAWLTDHGLVVDGTPTAGEHSKGVALRGWRWTELETWEGPQ